MRFTIESFLTLTEENSKTRYNKKTHARTMGMLNDSSSKLGVVHRLDVGLKELVLKS